MYMGEIVRQVRMTGNQDRKCTGNNDRKQIGNQDLEMRTGNDRKLGQEIRSGQDIDS